MTLRCSRFERYLPLNFWKILNKAKLAHTSNYSSEKITLWETETVDLRNLKFNLISHL